MKLSKNNQTLNDVSQLVEFAFDKKGSVAKQPVFLSRYNHADCYGFYQNDELTNLIMSNHFTVQIFDKEVKMSGVGYVASHSAYRGQGNIAKLMSELLNDLKEQNVLISQLAPFSESFYRRFGYENTSWQKIYHIPKEEINTLQSMDEGFIKYGTWNELKEDIKKVNYTIQNNEQLGSLVREDWWWERLNVYYPKRNYCVVYDDKNVACGYMFFNKDYKKSQLVIEEILYLTGFGIKKMLSLLKTFNSDFREVIYKGSVHESIEYYFFEQKSLTIDLAPFMMSRIVDFKSLIEILPVELEQVILEVTSDQYAPWNVGKWFLQDGKSKKTENTADISTTIQVWSAVLLGQLSIGEGVDLGIIKVKNGFYGKTIFQKGEQNYYDYF